MGCELRAVLGCWDGTVSSSHLFAIDRSTGLRRKVGGVWTRVWPLIYSSDTRCGQYPNPKRPRWRCKNPPLFIVQLTPEHGTTMCADCYAASRRTTLRLA